MSTSYVILRKIQVGDTVDWRHVGTVLAEGAPTALREHIRTDVANGESGDGTFVAVPARSFRPVTVKTETRTQLKFS